MKTVDPISLEVLRSRLEAIGEQASATLERTAISPVVTESRTIRARSSTPKVASSAAWGRWSSTSVPRRTPCVRRWHSMGVRSRRATCSSPTIPTMAGAFIHRM